MQRCISRTKLREQRLRAARSAILMYAHGHNRGDREVLAKAVRRWKRGDGAMPVLIGDAVAAEQALSWGLVDLVVAKVALSSRVDTMVETFGQKSSLVLERTNGWFSRAPSSPWALHLMLRFRCTRGTSHHTIATRACALSPKREHLATWAAEGWASRLRLLVRRVCTTERGRWPILPSSLSHLLFFFYGLLATGID